MQQTDVIIIGAGASGLMCAMEAGKRGRRVQVLDQSTKPGNKIRMSGGGRCNFTNYDVGPEHFISHNPHFCKSALSRFSQWDFLALVHEYQIPFHEREHGQLFCDESSQDILDMLLAECKKAGVEILLNTSVEQVEQLERGFVLHSSRGEWQCESLVMATGGLSIPTMGSSPFGYRIAEQFELKVWPTRAGLVPFTLQPPDKERYAALSGIAIDAEVCLEDRCFRENVLFTHRGLSGPAILQISNYWQAGQSVQINLLPDLDLFGELRQARQQQGQSMLKSTLNRLLPKRLVTCFVEPVLLEKHLAELSDARLQEVCNNLRQWTIKPGGTEGYRTAEVTLGGVDTNAVSSRTMEAKSVEGLYFVGEVLDVSGWLGGYNLQWAWSSGWCAGQFV